MLRPALLIASLMSLPLAPAAGQQPGPDRILHLGAQVRVRAPSVDSGWIAGTIVGSQRTPACVAVRLDHTDTSGRQQYAFLRAVTELKVDRRTNEGVLTLGLPAATEADWESWSKADLVAADARCKR
jgi:hypothetical protein